MYVGLWDCVLCVCGEELGGRRVVVLCIMCMWRGTRWT